MKSKASTGPDKTHPTDLSEQLLLEVSRVQLHQLPVVRRAGLQLQPPRELHHLHLLDAHGQLLVRRLGKRGALRFMLWG